MQKCNACGVVIRGTKQCCPLCRGVLSGTPGEHIFPVSEKRKVSKVSAVRICAFLLIVYVVAVNTYGNSLGHTLSWIPFSELVALVAFVDVCVIVGLRKNPIRSLTWQIYLGMALSLLYDWYKGWNRWSLVFFLPAVFILLVWLTVLTGKRLSMEMEDYLPYLLLDVAAAFVQVFFLARAANPFPLFAMISIGNGLLVWIGMMLFRGPELLSGLRKIFWI